VRTALEGLQLEGRGQYGGAFADLMAKLTAQARLTAPFAAPLQV
jgi:hypothetical protein